MSIGQSKNAGKGASSSHSCVKTHLRPAAVTLALGKTIELQHHIDILQAGQAERDL